MLRNGFLSASYKFKVLSLDAYGLQFLVMVDLIDVLTEKHFIELEAFVQESALIEHGLQVPAVYWRARELASHVKSPPKRAQRNFTEDLTRARAARAAQVAQAVPAPAPASTQFKPAVTRIFQRTGSSERGTGFADTEILEGEETLLSRTQFAAL